MELFNINIPPAFRPENINIHKPLKQSVVIFSGYNMRAVVAFCRYADRVGIPCHILAAPEDDPIFRTKYAGRVFLVRPTQKLVCKEVIGWLEAIRVSEDYDRVMVLPTSEFLNRFLLRHQQEFDTAGHLIPLAEPALYEQVSNKRSFTRTCVEFGLPVPHEFSQLPDHLPFVAKPLQYASSRTGRQLKPWLITDEETLERFRQSEYETDFFFQELVQGKSIYLLYCISQRGQDVIFSQENLVQQAEGGSIILARSSTVHRQPIAQKYLSMFKQLGYTGVLMIELKQTENEFVMIEANPRFWGPMQFVVDSENQLIRQFLLECDFSLTEEQHDTDHPDTRSNNGYYFWSGGLSESAKPFVFHNYSRQDFIQDYPKLIQNDVYLRDDTLEYYMDETRKRA